MSKRGAPPGHVGNPIGKNQYVDAAGEGLYQDQIGFRGPLGLKEEIKQIAATQGLSISEWCLEVIQAKLKEIKSSSVAK